MGVSAPIVKKLRVGSLSLEVREYADGRFGFDYTPPGERRAKVRARTLERAVGRANEILGAAKGGKVERLAIDEQEYAEFLHWREERRRRAKVPELIASFLRSKENRGLSAKHLRDLQHVLRSFGAYFSGNTLDAIKREDVENLLSENNVSPRTWNNRRKIIVSLFRFARHEGVLHTHLHPVERITAQKLKHSVETYTPEELKKMLAVVPREFAPVVVLGAFCGLRPEEIAPDPRTKKEGLRWEHILWPKNKIDVKPEVAKGGSRRRFAPLTDAAKAFLTDWKNSTGRVINPEFRVSNLFPAWSAASGVAWKADGWRHSFASYRLALTMNIHALAEEMGNSESVIRRHYLDIQHESEAEAWFAVRPMEPDGTL